MDGFHERKWFVYMGDHHEGPFSLADIQEKIGSGQASPASFVWAEGMNDWHVMTEVDAFDALLKPRDANSPPEMNEPTMASEPIKLATPELPANPMTESGPTPPADPVLVESVPVVEVPIAEAPPTQIFISAKPPESAPEPSREDLSKETIKKGRKRGRLVLILIFFLALLAGVAVAGAMGLLNPVLESPALKPTVDRISETTRPYLVSLSDKAPFLSKWISPIPAIDDILPEEFEELKKAASTPLENGAQASFALSSADLFNPSFHVASNLPDQAQLELFVEGIPETLLNHTKFSSVVMAPLTRHLGKTAVVRFPDGQPLPRGEFKVYLLASATQPEAASAALEKTASVNPGPLPEAIRGRKILGMKTYFLGGPNDATYSQRLKEFHDKLLEKATAELAEAKRYATELDAQLGSTIESFKKLATPAKGPKGKKAAPRPKQKEWNTFHSKWLETQAKLSESSRAWTPEALQTEYFYGVLFQLVQRVTQEIDRVHGVHHSWFTGAANEKTFEIQIGEAASQAEASLTALQSKIEQAEKIPPTANGMPQKEGL